jgi:hypothetical protein
LRTAFHGEGRGDAVLPRVEWNEADLGAYAAGAAPLTLRVLDYLASSRPDELLTGADFAAIDVTPDQAAGVAGAMARKVYTDFKRANPPIESVEIDDRWYYRMTKDTADVWMVVRQTAG